MPASFVTLPADCISKDIEKHDGMPANSLERFCCSFVLFGTVEDQVGSQVDLFIVVRTPLRK